MSAINTTGIDVNYPIPGINNPSQGFRNNFTSIKSNLDVASSEISDLQNKVVLKAGLDNTVINNDMANTLISNCATRSFRATTYNLGNALSGTVLVDVSAGDVQYGTVSGNVTLSFGGWAPTGTQSNVELQLSISNSSAVITFPNEVVSSNNNFGLTTLENYISTGNISVPYGVSQLDFRLSSLDCGNTITIEPYNRPRQTTQFQQRNPTPVGYQGDVKGTVSLGDTYNQLSLSSSNASDYFSVANTSQLYTDLPIVFSGVSMEANITIGTTYYVRYVPSSTTFTVSTSIGGANVNLAGNAAPTSPMYANPVSYTYVCVNNYNASTYTKTVTATTVTTNRITISNTTSLQLNSPIIFTGTMFGGLIAGVVYYIKSIPTGTAITVSRSRTNGIADTEVVLSTASGSCSVTAYVGEDIWKKVPLITW